MNTISNSYAFLYDECFAIFIKVEYKTVREL